MACPLTPPYPPPSQALRPPSALAFKRGGWAPGREGGMIGLMDYLTPQASTPTRTTQKRKADEGWEYRSGSAGWASVPRTCPPPPFFSPQTVQVAPGAYWANICIITPGTTSSRTVGLSFFGGGENSAHFFQKFGLAAPLLNFWPKQGEMLPFSPQKLLGVRFDS